MNTALVDVGAVIVHFHREQDVARLVEQLTVRDGVPPDQVVVVDNGSADDQLATEFARRYVTPRVLTPGNVGYAAGMNLGVAALPPSARVLLLLTHEVELAPDALSILARAVHTDPDVVTGPLLLTSPTTIWSAGGTLDGVRRLPGHRLRGASPVAAGSEPIECAWLDGAVIAMSTLTWSKLGGLDERYFLYAEDVDLGLRAQAAGHPVRVIPTAQATQAPSNSIDPYFWTRNTFLLFRKHHMWLAWLLWLASCVMGIARDALLRHSGTTRRSKAILDGVVGVGGPPPRAPK
jgi:N-acetylglucosaminyl-diphospho-decaprenol L-rhamnosyltransferase